jgi:RNA polymerase sigma-70 factor (ECF subfamily)
LFIEFKKETLYNFATVLGGQVGNYSSISIEELLRRCSASGEIDAWGEFVRRFHRLIAIVVLRTANRLGDCPPQTADDLIQETYLKLCADNCRLLRNFDERHPNAFPGFVKVVAANVVRDHFKASYSRKRGDHKVESISEATVPAAGDDSIGSPKKIERAVLIQEVQDHLEFCGAGEEHDRNVRIFWLYYRAGLSAGAIAALPGMGLTTKGVESTLLRITKELRARMTASNPVRKDPSQNLAKGVSPAESF